MCLSYLGPSSIPGQVSFPLLLNKALQLQLENALAFSMNSFHTFLSWTHLFKFLNFINLISFTASSSHLIFGHQKSCNIPSCNTKFSSLIPFNMPWSVSSDVSGFHSLRFLSRYIFFFLRCKGASLTPNPRYVGGPRFSVRVCSLG